MEIKAKVYKSDKSWLKGIASITIDDSFVVKNIRIINGKNGLFIAMPNEKVGDEYRDICFPINVETRQKITDAIMEEYNKNDEVISNDNELPF